MYNKEPKNVEPEPIPEPPQTTRPSRGARFKGGVGDLGL